MDNKKLYVVKKFKQNELIFNEGDQGTEAFFITKGNVEIFRKVEKKHVMIQLLTKGDLFGEMSIINNTHRTASAIAKDDVEVVKIDRETLRAYLKDSAPMLKGLISNLIKRLHNTTQKINDKPSNNTFLSVCSVINLMYKTITKDSINSQGKVYIQYNDLCRTVKEIVPLTEWDIERVFAHLLKIGYIEIFNNKEDDGTISKTFKINDPENFETKVKKIDNTIIDWRSEKDAFMQGHEFMDLKDVALLSNLDEKTLSDMIKTEVIPQNLLFFHREGISSWLAKRKKMSKATETYQQNTGMIDLKKLTFKAA